MSEENTLKIPKLVSAYDIQKAKEYYYHQIKQQFDEKIKECEIIAKKKSKAHEVKIDFKENEVIFRYSVRIDMAAHYEWGKNIHYRMENGELKYHGDMICDYDGDFLYEEVPNKKAVLLFQNIARDALIEYKKFISNLEIFKKIGMIQSVNSSLEVVFNDGSILGELDDKFCIWMYSKKTDDGEKEFFKISTNSVNILNKLYKKEEEIYKSPIFPVVPELYDIIELYEQKKNEKSNMIDKVKKLFKY